MKLHPLLGFLFYYLIYVIRAESDARYWTKNPTSLNGLTNLGSIHKSWTPKQNIASRNGHLPHGTHQKNLNSVFGKSAYSPKAFELEVSSPKLSVNSSYNPERTTTKGLKLKRRQRRIQSVLSKDFYRPRKLISPGNGNYFRDADVIGKKKFPIKFKPSNNDIEENDYEIASKSRYLPSVRPDRKPDGNLYGNELKPEVPKVLDSFQAKKFHRNHESNHVNPKGFKASSEFEHLNSNYKRKDNMFKSDVPKGQRTKKKNVHPDDQSHRVDPKGFKPSRKQERLNNHFKRKNFKPVIPKVSPSSQDKIFYLTDQNDLGNPKSFKQSSELLHLNDNVRRKDKSNAVVPKGFQSSEKRFLPNGQSDLINTIGFKPSNEHRYNRYNHYNRDMHSHNNVENNDRKPGRFMPKGFPPLRNILPYRDENNDIMDNDFLNLIPKPKIISHPYDAERNKNVEAHPTGARDFAQSVKTTLESNGKDDFEDHESNLLPAMSRKKLPQHNEENENADIELMPKKPKRLKLKKITQRNKNYSFKGNSLPTTSKAFNPYVSESNDIGADGSDAPFPKQKSVYSASNPEVKDLKTKIPNRIPLSLQNLLFGNRKHDIKSRKSMVKRTHPQRTITINRNYNSINNNNNNNEDLISVKLKLASKKLIPKQVDLHDNSENEKEKSNENNKMPSNEFEIEKFQDVNSLDRKNAYLDNNGESSQDSRQEFKENNLWRPKPSPFKDDIGEPSIFTRKQRENMAHHLNNMLKIVLFKREVADLKAGLQKRHSNAVEPTEQDKPVALKRRRGLMPKRFLEKFLQLQHQNKFAPNDKTKEATRGELMDKVKWAWKKKNKSKPTEKKSKKFLKKKYSSSLFGPRMHSKFKDWNFQPQTSQQPMSGKDKNGSQMDEHSRKQNVMDNLHYRPRVSISENDKQEEVRRQSDLDGVKYHPQNSQRPMNEDVRRQKIFGNLFRLPWEQKNRKKLPFKMEKKKEMLKSKIDKNVPYTKLEWEQKMFNGLRSGEDKQEEESLNSLNFDPATFSFNDKASFYSSNMKSRKRSVAELRDMWQSEIVKMDLLHQQTPPKYNGLNDGERLRDVLIRQIANKDKYAVPQHDIFGVSRLQHLY